jgi:Ala-tRNA(Pro) deacylase
MSEHDQRSGPEQAKGESAPLTAEELFGRLARLAIKTATVAHPPVFTVEEAKRLRGTLPGGHCKSLFLRNKKGAMWLVATLEDRAIDLKTLGERLGAGRVSFGSPDRLLRHLGVIPGAVTPFAVVNDREGLVKVALDREMLRQNPLNFHPLRNDRTTAIAPGDLVRFLESEGHAPQILDLA